MTYTTQDLIQFLAGERDACMDGKRLKLSPTNIGFPEEALAILQERGIQQIGAYHDFRTEIWKYQAQHLISGVVWQEIDVEGKLFRFPVIDDQLISLPSDLELMHSYKQRAVAFWLNVTQELQIWEAGTNIKGQTTPDTIVTPSVVELLISQCQWATLSTNHFERSLSRWTLDPEPYYQEIQIQIGWGCPELAGYWNNLPEHGSHWLTSVNPDAQEPEE